MEKTGFREKEMDFVLPSPKWIHHVWKWKNYNPVTKYVDKFNGHLSKGSEEQYNQGLF